MFDVGRPMIERKASPMNPTCVQTLDLLGHALRLMDGEGMHQVAARIAMAIDELSRTPECVEHPTIN